MGKKNQYSFSKRQREIKKKKKAEEKRARKLALKEGAEPDELLEQSEVEGVGVDGEAEEAGGEDADDGTD